MSTECVFGVLCQPARSWLLLTGRCRSIILGPPINNITVEGLIDFLGRRL